MFSLPGQTIFSPSRNPRFPQLTTDYRPLQSILGSSRSFLSRYLIGFQSVFSSPARSRLFANNCQQTTYARYGRPTPREFTTFSSLAASTPKVNRKGESNRTPPASKGPATCVPVSLPWRTEETRNRVGTSSNCRRPNADSHCGPDDGSWNDHLR